jgi:hypothetical protein
VVSLHIGAGAVFKSRSLGGARMKSKGLSGKVRVNPILILVAKSEKAHSSGLMRLWYQELIELVRVDCPSHSLNRKRPISVRQLEVGA